MSHGSLFQFNVFEPNAASRAQITPSLLDAAQEARIVLKTVLLRPCLAKKPR